MAVAIRKGRDVHEGVKGLLSELGITPGKRVYIKPNLSGRAPVIPGENTSLQVINTWWRVSSMKFLD